MIGAYVGGFVLYLLDLPFKIGGLNVLSFLTALIGSILLLAVISLFRKH